MSFELILFCSIFGLLIIASYTLGLRNGQKILKKEEVVMPEINPIKTIKQEIDEHQEKKKQEAYDIMMSNIDNYDGTGIGQKIIPD